MKFVATKTADQLRGRLVGQRAVIIDPIRAFLLERDCGHAGLRCVRTELEGILAEGSGALAPSA